MLFKYIQLAVIFHSLRTAGGETLKSLRIKKKNDKDHTFKIDYLNFVYRPANRYFLLAHGPPFSFGELVWAPLVYTIR